MTIRLTGLKGLFQGGIAYNRVDILPQAGAPNQPRRNVPAAVPNAQARIAMTVYGKVDRLCKTKQENLKESEQTASNLG